MRILLVEDSPEVSLITEEYLRELGHDTVAVVHAEGALEHLSSTGFDTVITDVSLPGMSGIDFAKEIAKRHPGLPIVIASGYGAVNLQTMLGRDLHPVFALQKPYDMDALEKTLALAASANFRA